MLHAITYNFGNNFLLLLFMLLHVICNRCITCDCQYLFLCDFVFLYKGYLLACPFFVCTHSISSFSIKMPTQKASSSSLNDQINKLQKNVMNIEKSTEIILNQLSHIQNLGLVHASLLVLYM